MKKEFLDIYNDYLISQTLAELKLTTLLFY